MQVQRPEEEFRGRLVAEEPERGIVTLIVLIGPVRAHKRLFSMDKN
jgi:hypothetical protein